MRFTVLTVATLGFVSFLAQAQEPHLHSQSQDGTNVQKREWRIGCAKSGKCSYYDDSGPLRLRDLSRVISTNTDPAGVDDHEHDSLNRRNNLGEVATRCKPKENIIQFFTGTKWSDFQNCGASGKCVDSRSGKSSCKVGKSVYIPTLVFSPAHRKRDYVPPTRCDPTTLSDVQFWDEDAHLWENFHQCEEEDSCKDIDGVGACTHPNGDVLVPSMVLPGDGPEPDEPEDDDFESPVQHNFSDSKGTETVCDPGDKAQKLVLFKHHGQWVKFYACRRRCQNFESNFLAACLQYDGQYVVPRPPVLDSRSAPVSVTVEPRQAAGTPSIDQSKPANPLRTKTRCHPSNATEIQEWNGHKWAYYGVCLSPYSCHGSGTDANFAVCAQPNLKTAHVWLPWPALSAPTHDGISTRCRNDRELYQFDGKQWMPYRQCTNGFSCQKMDVKPYNGGCVASSFEAIKKESGSQKRRVDAAEDADRYEPFNYAHALPKRAEAGLNEEANNFTVHDEVLSKELVHESDDRYQALYGSESQNSRREIENEERAAIVDEDLFSRDSDSESE